MQCFMGQLQATLDSIKAVNICLKVSFSPTLATDAKVTRETVLDKVQI